jgi:adhesin HecA-like repeat protein
LYCTGEETCNGAGACVSAGDPCPDTECNHCNEAGDSCFDPQGTTCTADGLYCTGEETCDGAGACVSAGNPCPGPDGDADCMESCDETGDGCWADDPDGASCADGLCESGSCVNRCAAPASCTEGCTDIVSGVSSEIFTYAMAAKLCVAENAFWTGRVSFDADGTLEVCGRAAPSGAYFNGTAGALNVRATGTLEINQPPLTNVDNEGLMAIGGRLDLNPDSQWTNRGRLEVEEDLVINRGGSLSLDSDSLVVVSGSFENNGIVEGIGSTCGAIRVEGSESYNNSGTIRNNADVCPLTNNSGTGPDIPACSCNPTHACGL